MLCMSVYVCILMFKEVKLIFSFFLKRSSFLPCFCIIIDVKVCLGLHYDKLDLIKKVLYLQ